MVQIRPVIEEGIDLSIRVTRQLAPANLLVVPSTGRVSIGQAVPGNPVTNLEGKCLKSAAAPPALAVAPHTHAPLPHALDRSPLLVLLPTCH